jgi:integrase
MKPEEVKQFECVKRWLDAISAHGTGSAGTQYLYPKQLTYFLSFANLNPDELIKIAHDNPGELKVLVDGYTIQRRKLSRSDNTTLTTIAIVMSFLRENGAEVRLRGPRRPGILRKTITKDELKALMTYANLRLRAFVTVMKDCGMSPVDVLKLKYGDVRKDLEAEKVPIKISMIRTKTKMVIETYLGPDAVRYLKDYLEYRKTGTEKIPPETLDDNSPLFRTFKAKVTPAYYGAIFHDFDRARKIARAKFGIYDLRRFFSTNMKAAGVNDTLVEHWMGHKLPGTIDAYFFSPENQEQEYMRAYPRIALEEAVSTQGWKQQLIASLRFNPNLTPAAIDAISKSLDRFANLNDFKDRDWEQILKGATSEKKRARPRSKKKGRKKPTAKDCESRYVTERQLPKFISEGWEYVAPVNGKILIKKRD